ncbi:MAG: hypothetical protein PSX80_03910 [bacterium]|nr:hypothetical protein [bacterium]
MLYCRGCGADLASVRTALMASDQGSIVSREVQLSERQLRRLRRRGFDGTETPLALSERVIEAQRSAIRGLFLSVGFGFITAIVYSSPPVGGIFWLLPLAFTFFFFSATLSRFVQAGMIKKLLRETTPPVALPDTQPEYFQPPRSIYETDDLQPRSVTDATTRHLR